MHTRNLQSALVTVGLASVLCLLSLTEAQAIPSFTRQTGRPCSGCHTVFPELTPYGRAFKLGGFVEGDKLESKSFPLNLPISVSTIVSRNSTRSTGDTPDDSFPRNRDVIVQEASIYYGGKIAGNFGALAQYKYNGIEHKSAIEMADIRYGNEIALGKDSALLYGVTLNNNPSIADIYNSSPMWGFPHNGADVAIMPNARTLVDNTLFAQVGGVGAYGLWNDLVYAEFAVYRRADKGLFRPFSQGVTIANAVQGNAPYWRVALQNESKPHSFMVGMFGMTGDIFPDPTVLSGPTDRFKDIGLDGQYQFINGDHVFTAHATWIREKQEWNASFPGGMTSNPSDTLRTSRADMHYYYRRQWGGGIQYFSTSGDADATRYNTGDPVTGSISGSPNTKGWLVDLNYLPLQNIKIGVRYTAYNSFNGSSTDYAGAGRNAKDNNSLFLYGWVLF